MLETSSVLESMLTENTGMHMCDSGGLNGRMWQRNQARDFKSEPLCSLNIDSSYIEVTARTYPFLMEHLEYAPEMDAEFQKFSNLPENEESPWLYLMESFVDNHPEYESRFGVINTYNGECLLDQTLQYISFELGPSEVYLLLQIHGGADVRGGYTKPKAFRFCESHSDGYLRVSNATIFCDSCDNFWYTDDAYHWYHQESGSNLEEFSVEEVEEYPETRKENVIYSKDGAGTCPCCKTGKLKAGI